MSISLSPRMKKIMLAVGSVVLAVGIFASVLCIRSVSASVTDNLSGYGWSSNIGWIKTNNCDSSTSCTGPIYGVTMDASGNLSGYAWSSNIGWISFNPDAVLGCPSGTCQAHLDMTTGNVTGWVRACSIFASGCSGTLADNLSRGDWDGWISLGNRTASVPFGVTFNGTTGSFNGCSAGSCAWGSDVIGWVDFGGVKVAAVTAKHQVVVTATPTTGTAGSVDPTITYSSPLDVPTSCVATGDWKTKPTSATVAPQSQDQGVLSTVKVYSYTLTCTYADSTTASATATVDVTSATNCPANQYYDTTTNSCVNNPTCSTGQVVDPTTHQCTCPSGTHLDSTTNSCVADSTVDECTNVPGTQALPLPPHYRQLSDGNGGQKCACVAGYVMNAQYQCVLPVYIEH